MAPIDGPDYSTSQGAESGMEAVVQRMSAERNLSKQLSDARDDLLVEMGTALTFLLIQSGSFLQSRDMDDATLRFREILLRARMTGL